MEKSDRFELDRFLKQQKQHYPTALAELRNGYKQSHWMWFIFPQLEGLGSSDMSKIYSIKSLKEARQYLAHAVLGARLAECAQALLAVEGRTAYQIMGKPDYLKLQSCMTLFAYISDPDSVFQRVLDKYYAGERDSKTIWLLEEK